MRAGSRSAGSAHDEVNRFLLQGNYTHKDLYEKAVVHLVAVGGTLTVDDSILDKPYTQLETDLITYLYSDKHHRTVKGIGLITLLYTDLKGVSLPVNFRVYDKSVGKTKNNYFQEMVKEVRWWGLRPKIVTGDSWYASTANFKPRTEFFVCHREKPHYFYSAWPIAASLHRYYCSRRPLYPLERV